MLNKISVLFLSLLLSTDAFSQEIIKILPLGNSITYDQRNVDSRPTGQKKGYRHMLYTLLTDAGYNFDFIGSYRSGYDYFPDADNSGFKGIDTENLADLIATGTSEFTGRITIGPYLNYYPADIVLLEIGTNDMYTGKYSVTFINNVLNSIDLYEQQSGNPVLVIIGTIISIQNYPCGSHAGVTLFNNNLETMVQNRISNGDKILLADMECAAGINYYNDMWDELHPNLTGYDKMGQKWFNTIDAINSKPVVYDIPNQEIAEGGNFATINLNNYVSDLDDPDASILWTTATEPQNLTITINSSKIATVIPKNANWNGTETVTFIATDPGKYIPKLHSSDQDAVTFKINPVNDPPVIESQTNAVTIDEEEPYSITLNDLTVSDPDDPPSNLTLIVLPGSNYTYLGSQITPAENFYGLLNVNVVVSDGKAQSNTLGFEINVVQINDPPVITSVPQTDADDYVTYSYTITAVDPENQNITYQGVVIPEWADFSSLTGILSGTPRYNDTGDFEVVLKASDGVKDTQQTFTIKVADINDIPEFTTEPDTVAPAGQQYIYIFSATDVDENDILSYSIISKPQWLDYNSGQYKLSGIPDTSDIGSSEIIIEVSDGKDESQQVFTLSVKLFSRSNPSELEHSVLTYPVPATDHIYISSSQYDVTGISIYDLNGKLLLSEKTKIKNDLIRIDIKSVQAGFFLLNITTTGGVVTKKLLIE